MATRGVKAGTKRGPYTKLPGVKKKGTPEQLLKYYAQRVKSKMIDEQALREARGGAPTTNRIKSFFKEENLSYKKLYEEGITRKEGNKTVRYYKEAAVLLQIKSLQNRASNKTQKIQFIDNYIEAMEKVGFSAEEMREVEKAMRGVSNNQLSYAINEGYLPSISFIYAYYKNKATTNKEESKIEEILTGLGISKKASAGAIKKARKLKKNVKERLDVLDDLDE